MPLIIQPSNSEKNLILTHMILLLYIHPSTLLVDSLEHIFSATLSIELGEKFLQRQKKARENYSMRREIVENILREWKSFLNVRDDLDYDNINCSTHNHNHIHIWETRQLTTFPPHHLSLFAQKIFVVGVRNGIVYES